MVVNYQKVVPPFQYSTEFRLHVCERMLNGERVASLGDEFAVSVHALYRWRRQALIDAGREAGIKSSDVDPLADARRRIKELEAELALVKTASAFRYGPWAATSLEAVFTRCTGRSGSRPWLPLPVRSFPSDADEAAMLRKR